MHLLLVEDQTMTPQLPGWLEGWKPDIILIERCIQKVTIKNLQEMLQREQICARYLIANWSSNWMQPQSEESCKPANVGRSTSCRRKGNVTDFLPLPKHAARIKENLTLKMHDTWLRVHCASGRKRGSTPINLFALLLRGPRHL
jgi:hypothetical protein